MRTRVKVAELPKRRFTPRRGWYCRSFNGRAVASAAIVALLCVALSGCAAKRYSFVRMSHGADQGVSYDRRARPNLTDAVALNFADSVATLLRARFNGARITREVSSTVQVGLAAVAGLGSVFSLGPRTLAVLGLGSAGIPELQGIFNARGRAEVYQDAVRLIEEAQVEYLAFNQSPSDSVLTQNGVTLLQRVTASIHVVEKTLAGRLPSVRDMQQATERMTQAGATRTKAGAPAYNLNPADGATSTVAEQEDRKTRTAAASNLKVRRPRSAPPGPELPPQDASVPTTAQMRDAIDALARQENTADAPIFTDLFPKSVDPASVTGGSAAIRLLEAYKRADPDTQRGLYDGVIGATTAGN